MIAPTPKRRWFTFKLRTLFVVVTMASCWLGWQVHIVQRRRTFLAVNEQGGTWVHPDFAQGLPFPTIRRWMGDEPRGMVSVHRSSDMARERQLFPGALLICDGHP